MNYRRVFIPGASYFFTLNLHNRQSDLLTQKIQVLRKSFQLVKINYPFLIDAAVVLPDHLHLVITLPPGDKNYSKRINYIKSAFSRQIQPLEFINKSRQIKRERGIWQRRFWEHLIKDERDYETHLNYIHFNPVKHGYVKGASQWPYSSIHRYIKAGVLPPNWGTNTTINKNNIFKFGE